MARKYDWKRRTELLVQEIGRFLAYKMANDGATRAGLNTTLRGERVTFEWRKTRRHEFTTVGIRSKHICLGFSLKHGEILRVSNWGNHEEFASNTIDWKKTYKNLERVLYRHLVEEWGVEILADADNNYHWGDSCTKN